MLKRIGHYMYSKANKLYFSLKFILLVNKEAEKIYIFDIDNTIANTWPSFLQSYETLEERLSSLAVFHKMREHILDISSKGNKVIFLTARPYKTYSLTFTWLKNLGLIENKYDLFLVSKPLEKIDLLKKTNKEVYFYDDMTYNHEKGEIKYYENEIRLLGQLSYVKYYGLSDINKIHEGLE